MTLLPFSSVLIFPFVLKESFNMIFWHSQGIIDRDEIVFQKVRQRRIPIVMLTSGGYQRVTAAVIADSIANLNKKSLVNLSSH